MIHGGENSLGKGTVIAQLYTAREALPLEDVAVAVMQERDGVQALVAFRSTDANGKTEPVEIETPPEEASKSPSETRPFGVCNLRIYHPDYYGVVVRDVSVFEGQQSIEYLELIPLPENVREEEKNIFYEITPPEL